MSSAEGGTIFFGHGRAMHTFENLLEQLVKRGGSDLHITAGSPPKIRIDGKLVDIGTEPLSPRRDTKKLDLRHPRPRTRSRASRRTSSSTSRSASQALGRFRTNVFQQRGAVGAVLRLDPDEILGFEELGLPREVCERICCAAEGARARHRRDGLGQVDDARVDDRLTSTARAATTSSRSRTRSSSCTRNKKCLVNQREVGTDTHGFKKALRAVLRQDPDVVLVGEMRDLETIEAALTLAETGHLTFATLHTSRRRPDDQPHRRRVPGAPAAADPHAALVHAAGGLLPAAHRR